LKLLLDEMYSDAIATELRARGHDALSVREVNPPLAGAPDDEVIGFAAAQGRTLVTENVRDYGPLELALLAAEGHHHGILYTTDRQFPRGDPQTLGRLVIALDALLADPPPMSDRSIFLR
jgi:predicted nuclease of predicted toxin-antitoxin system